ncbi:hypothetical protein [Mycoplasma sp. VS1572C]
MWIRREKQEIEAKAIIQFRICWLLLKWYKANIANDVWREKPDIAGAQTGIQ